MPRSFFAALTLAAFLLVTGCSSSGGSGAGSSSAAPSAVCSSVAALKSSLAQLKNLNISNTSIEQLKSKLTAVGTEVRQLSNAAKSQYSKHAEAIQHDYASLESAIKIAVQNPTYPTIASVKTEFTTLANSVASLTRTVSSSC